MNGIFTVELTVAQVPQSTLCFVTLFANTLL
jgi:hypothetical protein